MTIPFKTQFFSQPNIGSVNIIDRSITTNDIALGTIDISNLSTACIATLKVIPDGIITEAKLAPELQTALLTFSYNLNNLMFVGWYGTFTIKNNQNSDASITFTVEAHTYNLVTNTTDVRALLGSTTLAHNQEEVITLAIHERLTNDESIIKILYTLGGGNVDSTNETGVTIEDDTGSVYDLKVQSAFRHNGNIEFEVTIVV